MLAYPRSDPRRDELIAELYAIPSIQRPLWVAQQLEVALFEGLGHRVSVAIRRLTGQRQVPLAYHDTQTGLVNLLKGQPTAGTGVHQAARPAPGWRVIPGPG